MNAFDFFFMKCSSLFVLSPLVDYRSLIRLARKPAGCTDLHLLILAQHDQTVWRIQSGFLLLCSLSLLAQKKVSSKAIRLRIGVALSVYRYPWPKGQ
jgi:hypothetical protein